MHDLSAAIPAENVVSLAAYRELAVVCEPLTEGAPLLDMLRSVESLAVRRRVADAIARIGEASSTTHTDGVLITLARRAIELAMDLSARTLPEDATRTGKAQRTRKMNRLLATLGSLGGMTASTSAGAEALVAAVGVCAPQLMSGGDTPFAALGAAALRSACAVEVRRNTEARRG